MTGAGAGQMHMAELLAARQEVGLLLWKLDPGRPADEVLPAYSPYSSLDDVPAGELMALAKQLDQEVKARDVLGADVYRATRSARAKLETLVRACGMLESFLDGAERLDVPMCWAEFNNELQKRKKRVFADMAPDGGEETA